MPLGSSSAAPVMRPGPRRLSKGIRVSGAAAMRDATASCLKGDLLPIVRQPRICFAHGASAMRHFDVFNGDADGICSLHQLRLAEPVDATIVTGLKRDIALLQAVPARRGHALTVPDNSPHRD